MEVRYWKAHSDYNNGECSRTDFMGSLGGLHCRLLKPLQKFTQVKPLMDWIIFLSLTFHYSSRILFLEIVLTEGDFV